MAADQGGREALNSAWTQGMPDVLCCMCKTAAGNDAHALNLLIFKSAQEASYSDCPCQLETRQKPPPHRYSQRKCPKNIILPHCQHTRNAPHFTLPNAMNFLSNVYIFLTLVTLLYFYTWARFYFWGEQKPRTCQKVPQKLAGKIWGQLLIYILQAKWKQTKTTLSLSVWIKSYC